MSDNQPGIEHKHAVRIHIDREPYESPNPTTGAALYMLGGVGAHDGCSGRSMMIARTNLSLTMKPKCISSRMSTSIVSEIFESS